MHSIDYTEIIIFIVSNLSLLLKSTSVFLIIYHRIVCRQSVQGGLYLNIQSIRLYENL